ncbi:hypothetical protein K474DRAFT_1384178 [Panus rudis PR-1116 ss-1]|nr:hypothetical protein K474DRAFT_1384178 [Panus rudis PR-1116 ss-1]
MLHTVDSTDMSNNDTTAGLDFHISDQTSLPISSSETHTNPTNLVNALHKHIEDFRSAFSANAFKLAEDCIAAGYQAVPVDPICKQIALISAIVKMCRLDTLRSECQNGDLTCLLDWIEDFQVEYSYLVNNLIKTVKVTKLDLVSRTNAMTAIRTGRDANVEEWRKLAKRFEQAFESESTVV